MNAYLKVAKNCGVLAFLLVEIEIQNWSGVSVKMETCIYQHALNFFQCRMHVVCFRVCSCVTMLFLLLEYNPYSWHVMTHVIFHIAQ